MKIAILDDYQGVALDLADWPSLPTGTEIEVFRDPVPDEDALVERLAPFDAVVAMRERTAFPASVLGRLPRLKLIASTGLRNAAIDLDACARRGIVACGAPGAPNGLAATAEVAWALVLALAKRVVASDAAARRGVWQPELAEPLAGRVLGLVGLGNLGRRMARIAGAFDMPVIAWSPHLTPERAAAAGVRAVGKRELFESADVVSLHLVLSASTAGIVGRDEIGAMKPTATLVNTARAGLIDEAALLDALRGRRIAGAGLDVHWREPLPAGDPWLALDDNVVLSPHLGYATRDNLAAFYRGVVENLRIWMAGGAPRPLGA